MEKMTLKGGSWKMQIVGENVYGITQEEIPAVIPGSVYGNLLSQGLIPDPYDGMNELTALKLMENDFRFLTTFILTREQMERLNMGAAKAGAKGINESLVIVDSLAFIVNVPNQTVITAMDQTETSANVFTNIDGAVIM